MHIAQVSIQHFRLIQEVSLSLFPGLVAFCGPNASGKTSLLEAVYMLGTGRSFRTANPATAIQHDTDKLQIAAELTLGEGLPSASMGIRRGARGDFSAKVMGIPVKVASELARQLPLQLINPDILALMTQGPDARRSFIDFGLFYAVPEFRPCWQQYKHCLKQRNAWLRASHGTAHSMAWEKGLAEAGEKVASLRLDYLNQLIPAFQFYADELLGDLSLDLQIVRGWSKKISLQEALASGLEADRAAGHTQSGPHRADLSILSAGYKAKDVLSRGQQKLLVCALKFAQERVLQEKMPEFNSIFLLDDLASELDITHLGKVLLALAKISQQSLLTVLDQDTLDRMIQALQAQAKLGDARWQSENCWSGVFYVDQGTVTPAPDIVSRET